MNHYGRGWGAGEALLNFSYMFVRNQGHKDAGCLLRLHHCHYDLFFNCFQQKTTPAWTNTSILPSCEWKEHGQHIDNSWWGLQRRAWRRWLPLYGICFTGNFWIMYYFRSRFIYFKIKFVNNLVSFINILLLNYIYIDWNHIWSLFK